MKFIILSILGVFAFRTSGVSADCCQTSGECPEGYDLAGYSLNDNNLVIGGGISLNDNNIVCGVKIDGTISCGSTVDSSMKTCPGDDVPTPTSSTPAPFTPTPPTPAPSTPIPPTPAPLTPAPPTPAPLTPASPASTCCQTSGECPEGYDLVGISLNDNNIVCGVKIDGTISCGTVDSSMKTCPGDDVLTSTLSTPAPSTPTPPTPAPPTPASPASTCCQTSGECPEGYKSIGSFDNNIFTVGLTIIGSNKVCNFNYGSCTAIDSSMAICSGNDLLSTPTPPTPSSAGKIGMGYVWFVAAAAAAAAFAGIN